MRIRDVIGKCSFLCLTHERMLVRQWLNWKASILRLIRKENKALFISECNSRGILRRSGKLCVDSHCVITLIDNTVLTDLTVITKIKGY